MSKREDFFKAFANGYTLLGSAQSSWHVTHNEHMLDENVTRLYLHHSVVAEMKRDAPRTLTLDAHRFADHKVTVTALKAAFEGVMPMGYTLKRERGVFIVRDPQGQTILEFERSGALTTAHPCKPVRSDDREYATA